MIAHLKVHSSFSLMTGVTTVNALVDQAVADGMTALALTDRNVLYGAVKFWEACHTRGIRPIIGMTATIAAPASDIDNQPSDIVLLAKNVAGYRSLCHLSAWLQAHPDRLERLQRGLPWQVLGQHREGLLAIEAGRNGRLYRLLRAGKSAEAGRYVARFGGLFAENGYLGLELTTPAESATLAPQLTKLGERFGIPLVAIQPIFCLAPQQRDLFQLLSAIDNNCRLPDVLSSDLPDGGNSEIDLHWFSAESLQNRYADYPDALAHIDTIVEQIEPCLPDGKPIWPVLDLPERESAESTLRHRAAEGLKSRYAKLTPTIVERLEHELKTIIGFGFDPLFLIVADIVRYAHEAEVPVSTRGSVANSLVAYCLGITTVDPIEHDLLFERFLNPARRSLPDIDLDFCSRRRDIVLNYVREKYGADRVALVATVNTFKKKSAVREAAKALGYNKEQTDPLVSQLPSGWHPDPRRRDKRTLHEIVGDFENEQDRAVIAAAAQLIGLPHHLSVHPGGMVITPKPLNYFVPTQWTTKGFVITQYPHEDVEKIGLPKLDLLGIRALTVQADSAEIIRKLYDPTFDINNIDLTDPATQHTIASGDTIGVFQCESRGAQSTQRKLKAKTIRDLAVANAFFKPGPATGGMAKNFVRRYRGEEKPRYLHPALEPILAPTMGVMIFQEQILRVVREIGGLDWVQANQIRKGMSKFDAQAIHNLEQEFVTGCQRDEVAGGRFSAEQAKTLWNQVVAFAGYGFNQGHATAYADVSYRAAYLKTHFPAAFLCARLINGGGYYHPAVYVEEARRLGISIRAPHINHSGRHVTLTRDGEQQTLWMGLGWVRALRRSTVEAIITNQPFSSLADLLQRVDVQPKERLHLIQCGALDGLSANRATLLKETKQKTSAGQMSFGFVEEIFEEEESATERIQWEAKLVGFPLTDNPASPSPHSIKSLTPAHGQRATISGMRLPSWDSGFLLSDGTGIVHVTIPKGSKLRPPRRWRPAVVSGIWQIDEVGNTSLEVINFVRE